MDKVKCHLIIHSRAQHLNQIYTGFLELKKKGFIDLTLDNKINSKEHILEVIVNDSIRIIYDTFDEGSVYTSNIEENQVDFYFKRSYSPNTYCSKFKNILPLGLNYNVYSSKGNLLGRKENAINKLKKIVKNKKMDFNVKDFEYYPNISDSPQICFLTRMWDPNGNEVENNAVKAERVEINEFRSACIKECKKEFKGSFIGGIEDSEFSRRYYGDCIVDPTFSTKRANFLKVVKQSEICIATTGLHKSIGWKFGEYVAAARAIITEPLNYKLPGTFENEINYLQFNSVEELIKDINVLKKDTNYRFELMMNNYNYYNNFVKPDKLIMNTLFQIIKSEEILW